MTQAESVEQLEVPVASRKRRALAIYLDFLLFGALWTLAGYWIGPLIDLRWGKYVVFLVLEILVQRVKYSPGLYILSIYRYGDEHDEFLGVSPEVKSKETWITMILGTVLLIDGPRMLVRWTQIPFSRPYFGIVPDYAVGAILEAAVGAAEVFTAIALLKMSRTGLWAAAILATSMLISTLLSWDLFPQFLETYAQRRAELVGREFDPRMVDFMVPIVAGGTAIVWFLLGLIAVLYRKRLTNDLRST